MSHGRIKISIAVVLVGLLLVGLAGCKGKPEAEPNATEPNATAKTAGGTPTTLTAVGAIAQTTCPVMGGPINKDVSTEYKGKKVYFCCQACVDKFKAEPEKYAAKLP